MAKICIMKRNKEITTGFPERLISLRRQKKSLPDRIGKVCGGTLFSYWSLRTWYFRLAVDSLKKLTNALGVSEDYLIEGITEDAAKANFEDRGLLL